MNTINITAVTPETVCIHGQTLAREYAETVLLGLLIASEGENHAGIVKVAEAFTGAGLSLEAHPKASRACTPGMSTKSNARRNVWKLKPERTPSDAVSRLAKRSRSTTPRRRAGPERFASMAHAYAPRVAGNFTKIKEHRQ